MRLKESAIGHFGERPPSRRGSTAQLVSGAPYLLSFLAFSSLLVLPLVAQVETGGASAAEQALREQKHFLECLAFVYRPVLWIGYNEKLYFMPKTAAQEDQVASMKEARSQYQVFTDRPQRHQLAAEALAESGLSEGWQKKLLLPYSDTNQNLTPTIEKPLRILPTFNLLQSLSDGDALLEDDTGQVYFVMSFGRGPNDATGTKVY